MDRASVDGYRGQLVRRQVYNNRVNTDTDAIRERYRGQGLDLAALIEAPISSRLDKLAGWTAKCRSVDWRRNSTMLIAAFVGLFVAGFVGGPGSGDLSASVGFIGCCCLAGGGLAARLNSRTSIISSCAGLVAALLAPLLCAMGEYAAREADYLFGAPELVLAVLWSLAVVNMVLDARRIDELPERVALRRDFLWTRDYLKAQLRIPDPGLGDDWYPYILGFGPGAHVDRRFKAHGRPEPDSGSAPGGTASGSSAGGAASRAEAGATWTGGGGAFGGAGASGSWAIAAGAIGAGVSAPGRTGDGGSPSSGGGEW